MLKSLEPEALLADRGIDQFALVGGAPSLRTFLGMSLRKRLEIVLAELAERFGVPDARGMMLLPELAQEELAEMIGSSRPMVSKLLIEMTERGMLIREGRRHILLARSEAGRRNRRVRSAARTDRCIRRSSPRARPRAVYERIAARYVRRPRRL